MASRRSSQLSYSRTGGILSLPGRRVVGGALGGGAGDARVAGSVDADQVAIARRRKVAWRRDHRVAVVVGRPVRRLVEFGDEGVVVFAADELGEVLGEELEAEGEAV